MNLQVLLTLPEPRELLAAMQDVSRRDAPFRRKYRQLLQQFEESLVNEEQREAALIAAHHDFEFGRDSLSHHDPYVFYDDDAWLN